MRPRIVFVVFVVFVHNTAATRLESSAASHHNGMPIGRRWPGHLPVEGVVRVLLFDDFASSSSQGAAP
jgi:hypothetical protein